MHAMDLAVKRNSATLKEPPHYLVSASINATFSTLGLAGPSKSMPRYLRLAGDVGVDDDPESFRLNFTLGLFC